jgi:hypothetical protein
MRKTIVTNNSFVECPYCPKGLTNQFKRIHWKHLSTVHGKTLDMMWIDFPNIPTITKEEQDRVIKAGRKGTEIFTANLKGGKTKVVKCYYNLDPDCSHEEKEVPLNHAGFHFCSKCEKLGKENPDGRTKEHANKEREEYWLNKTNGKATHQMQVSENVEKMRKTCEEKDGGIGYAGKNGKKSLDSSLVRFGDVYPMKTEEGKELWREGNIKSFGFKSPTLNPAVAEKISKTLTGQPSQLKGKTYVEIHGEKKAKELIEQRKISGAKGYEKSRRISKPQIDLYKLIDSIWYDYSCMLDYQYLNYFLDVAIGELQLDFEYDSIFYHDPQSQSDASRTKFLNNVSWKVVRFIDKLPTREEIIKIIDDRIIELNSTNPEILAKDINCFVVEALKYTSTYSFPKLHETYQNLGGKDDVQIFTKRFIILQKIMNNTYNQCCYDDLCEVWTYYIEDKKEGLIYLELLKYSNKVIEEKINKIHEEFNEILSKE